MFDNENWTPLPAATQSVGEVFTQNPPVDTGLYYPLPFPPGTYQPIPGDPNYAPPVTATPQAPTPEELAAQAASMQNFIGSAGDVAGPGFGVPELGARSEDSVFGPNRYWGGGERGSIGPDGGWRPAALEGNLFDKAQAAKTNHAFTGYMTPDELQAFIAYEEHMGRGNPMEESFGDIFGNIGSNYVKNAGWLGMLAKSAPDLFDPLGKREEAEFNAHQNALRAGAQAQDHPDMEAQAAAQAMAAFEQAQAAQQAQATQEAAARYNPVISRYNYNQALGNELGGNAGSGTSQAAGIAAKNAGIALARAGFDPEGEAQAQAAAQAQTQAGSIPDFGQALGLPDSGWSFNI